MAHIRSSHQLTVPKDDWQSISSMSKVAWKTGQAMVFAMLGQWALRLLFSCV